jgi:hypothetical protein
MKERGCKSSTLIGEKLPGLLLAVEAMLPQLTPCQEPVGELPLDTRSSMKRYQLGKTVSFANLAMKEARKGGEKGVGNGLMPLVLSAKSTGLTWLRLSSSIARWSVSSRQNAVPSIKQTREVVSRIVRRPPLVT